jgi:hypothetical protein
MCHSYSVLLPVGFAVPPLLPAARCAFTAPFRPYRHECRRFVFCGTFPWVTPAGNYPAPFLAGARTFLPYPVSQAAAVARPSGILTLVVPHRPWQEEGEQFGSAFAVDDAVYRTGAEPPLKRADRSKWIRHIVAEAFKC